MHYREMLQPPHPRPNLLLLSLQRAGLTMADVDYHEINEAFAAVVLANATKLGLLVRVGPGARGGGGVSGRFTACTLVL